MSTIRSRSGKKLSISLIVFLLVFIFIGSCWAYMSDSDYIKNTFLIGSLKVELVESEKLDLVMAPGRELMKDPKVVLEEESVDSYVFVKVKELNDFSRYMDYSIRKEWDMLQGHEGVYYVELGKMDDVQEIYVLEDNKVIVKESITNEDMKSIPSNSYPKLVFSAYAIEKGSAETPEDAWDLLNVSN